MRDSLNQQIKITKYNKEALLGVLRIRDNWQNNFSDNGYLTKNYRDKE